MANGPPLKSLAHQKLWRWLLATAFWNMQTIGLAKPIVFIIPHNFWLIAKGQRPMAHPLKSDAHQKLWRWLLAMAFWNT